MAPRIQSPSSINTYKQCPRKYYYQYIMQLPTHGNVHTIRGKIAHTVLEKFFEVDASTIREENFREELAFYLKNLFDAVWSRDLKQFKEIGVSNEEIKYYYNETTLMMANWVNNLFERIEEEMKNKPFKEAFEAISPEETEKEFKSEELKVRGFVDYIERHQGTVRVMDYKTGKAKGITPEYRLQLGIYALLYQEAHGTIPDKVGVWFLQDREIVIDVDESLLLDAKFEIEQIHAATISDDIKDYPKHISSLCKWSTGQCDFYNTCMKKC